MEEAHGQPGVVASHGALAFPHMRELLEGSAQEGLSRHDTAPLLEVSRRIQIHKFSWKVIL